MWGRVCRLIFCLCEWFVVGVKYGDRRVRLIEIKSGRVGVEE